MKHFEYALGFPGSLEALATSVGNMRYDKVAEFLTLLADDFKRQADDDLKRGRPKLAKRLYETANQIYLARDEMLLTWKICEPYMKDEEK